MKWLHEDKEPTFLCIKWEAEAACREQPNDVTLEAVLCLRHRQEIAVRHANARGCGQLGESCDLCEGRLLLGSDGKFRH
jgi:hypothetical protein